MQTAIEFRHAEHMANGTQESNLQSDYGEDFSHPHCTDSGVQQGDA